MEDLGLSYKSAEELKKPEEFDEVMRRGKIWKELGQPEGIMLEALFGAQPNTVMLTDVLDYYFKHTRDRMLGLSGREVKKKTSPIKLAVKRFSDFAGSDVGLHQITRNLAQDYRSYLIDIVENGSIKPNTADKQIVHVRKIISHYIEQNNLTLVNPFSRLGIKGEVASRPPYSLDFLKDRWLKGDPFASLNPTARDMLLAMIDTGCGAKELCGLAKDDISLAEDIPFINIRPNTYRKLKTDHRGRIIPLVGHALDALRRNPDGFIQYRTNSGADNFSAVATKYLSNCNSQAPNG